MRIAGVGVLCAVIGLAGCSLESTAPAGVETGLQMHGTVHGGQQPVSGAHVYLLAAGTSGYGGASVSVMTSGDGADAIGNYVVTDGGGRFTLGSFTCAGTQQLYALATGGNPGAGTNSSIGEMAVVGGCGAFGPSFFLSINEVATVAAAYAMAGFATDATHVSSSGTALAQVGVANAFANAGNLVTLGTGKALATTPAGNGTVPQATINTLANILAACVNSNGGTTIVTSSGGTATQTPAPCGTLFGNAVEGASQPSDTATAAINMAHHPAANVAALYGLQTATAPFQTGLTRQPNDFTISILFTGGGLNGPVRMAVDGLGNVWVTNGLNCNCVSEFSPLGVALSPAAGYTGSFYNLGSIAIDTLGNAWVADNYFSYLAKLSPSGSLLSGTGYKGGGISGPFGVAIDGTGNVWVGNEGTAEISEFSSAGTAISGSSGYAAPYYPAFVAIDGTENVWTQNGNNSLSKFSSSGVAISSPTGYTGGGLAPLAESIAIDHQGNAWVVNHYDYEGGSLSEFNSSGAAISPATTGYTGGGISQPTGLAIDGNGNVWVSNTQSHGVSEFSSAGVAISPAASYVDALNYFTYTVAIDGSGDVWAVTGNTDLNEYIGAAVPVVTPLAAGVKNNTLGTRP